MVVKVSGARSGGSFVRAALALAGSRNMTDAIQRARAMGAAGEAITYLETKAAASAATLADPGWAGDLADHGGAAVGFIESLRSQSAFYRFAKDAQIFPLRQRGVICAMLETGGEVAEGAWLPAAQGSFAPFELKPRRTGGVIVISRELVDSTDPANFTRLRRELERAAVASVDTTFFTVALAGTTPATADPDDIVADLRAMLGAVAKTGAEVLHWAAGAAAANFLATATDLTGARLFPTLGPNGGSLLGRPLMVSDRLPAGRLVLADAAGFAVNEGSIEVDRSEGSALQMKSDPGQAQAELVSLFQAGLVALRVLAGFGCERLRDGAVSALDLPSKGS